MDDPAPAAASGELTIAVHGTGSAFALDLLQGMLTVTNTTARRVWLSETDTLLETHLELDGRRAALRVAVTPYAYPLESTRVVLDGAGGLLLVCLAAEVGTVRAQDELIACIAEVVSEMPHAPIVSVILRPAISRREDWSADVPATLPDLHGLIPSAVTIWPPFRTRQERGEWFREQLRKLASLVDQSGYPSSGATHVKADGPGLAKEPQHVASRRGAPWVLGTVIALLALVAYSVWTLPLILALHAQSRWKRDFGPSQSLELSPPTQASDEASLRVRSALSVLAKDSDLYHDPDDIIASASDGMRTSSWTLAPALARFDARAPEVDGQVPILV